MVIIGFVFAIRLANHTMQLVVPVSTVLIGPCSVARKQGKGFVQVMEGIVRGGNKILGYF
jgi:hypothetical protein